MLKLHATICLYAKYEVLHEVNVQAYFCIHTCVKFKFSSAVIMFTSCSTLWFLLIFSENNAHVPPTLLNYSYLAYCDSNSFKIPCTVIGNVNTTRFSLYSALISELFIQTCPFLINCITPNWCFKLLKSLNAYQIARVGKQKSLQRDVTYLLSLL